MTNSASFAPLATFLQTMEEAFPVVDPGHVPLGERVLVQMRSPKTKTASGILLVEETKDAIHWNNQAGKIIAMGPVAFKNRSTLVPWPEGSWCSPGDFVRVPKYGGDKFEVKLRNAGGIETGEVALFILCKDLDLIAKVTCDPREVISFV